MIETISSGVVTGLIVGIILACVEGRRNKREKMREATENARREKDNLLLDLVLSVTNLAFTIAASMHTNKDIEDGVAQAKADLAKFRNFEREQITKI